jgi:TRAP-type C4-dicarboxylate transport system permease small subunit
VTAFLERYARLLAGIGRVELGVARACLGTIVVCIFGQVVSRYGFGRPLAWVEELATYCFIWGTFVGASIGLRRGTHLRVETFLGRLPPGARRGVQDLTRLAIALFCLLLVVNGLKAAWIFEWGQRTIALPVELPRYLFFSGPLVLASASMLLTVVHDLLASLAASRAAPRPPPAPASPA